MKTIGIKLADGTFYPILEEGTPKQRMLDLTTVKDNQTKVQIDLYRSETGSMADAEYVDTLEVPAINPHPNGEPELHLSLGIDENGELKAELVDEETGTKSETQVNLITRSSEERSEPNDFTISDVQTDIADSDKTIIEDPSDNKTIPEEITEAVDIGLDEPPEEDTLQIPEEVDIAPEKSEEGAFDTNEPFSFDDFDSNNTAETDDNTEIEAEQSPHIPSENLNDILDSIPDFGSEESVQETSDSDESISEEDILTEEAPSDTSDVTEENNGFTDISLDTFNLPDVDTLGFDDISRDQESNEMEQTLDITPPELSEVESEPVDTEEYIDIDMDLDEGTDLAAEDFENNTEVEGIDLETQDMPSEPDAVSDIDTQPFELPDFDSLDSTAADTDTLQSSDTVSDDLNTQPFELPDFDSLDSTAADTDTLQSSDTVSDDLNTQTFDLPDFDSLDSTAADTTDDSFEEKTFDLPDFDDITIGDTDTSTQVSGITGLFDDTTFDDPLFHNASTDSFTSKFNTDDLDIPEAPIAASGSALDFSDLYDSDTLAGEHATPYDEEEDEIESKTRLPVLICIVCAIICLIATALILFVFPSKYNLIKNQSHKQEQNEEEVTSIAALPETNQNIEITVTPVETISAESTKPKAPSAQEDKIVISPTPDVVPVAKPPVTEAARKKDVKYHIKWGDTLWDISYSYYKTPWRYPKIATYNKIKDPDLIISGTDILIPVE